MKPNKHADSELNQLRTRPPQAKHPVGITLAVVLAMAVSMPATADSPDPVDAGTTGTATENPDGSTTLTLSGTWVFERDCGERLVGWEVDWNDPDAPGYPIDDIADVGSTGNSLNPVDNTVDLGETNCVDGDDGSSGTWGPISHTYGSGVSSAAPCVVVYDVKEDKIGDDGKHSTVAGGSDRNEDNSAEDNQNEAHQGCFPIEFTFDPPECNDGADNDGDGLTDYPYDPGCSGPDDDDESDLPQCSDGDDNDGDGLTDAEDPGCINNGAYDPNDDDETDLPACSDTNDNDGDGLTDAEDPGCYTDGEYDPNDDDETNLPQCSDGNDNDGDGLTDAEDPGCYTDGEYDPNDDDETNLPQCSDGDDNDGDGLTDAEDPGCYTDGEYNPNDDDENDVPQCSDGDDNDGDGLTDAEDPGCINNGEYDPNDDDETDLPACSDTNDNDGDGATDANDPGCYPNGEYDPNDDDESNPECSDGINNDPEEDQEIDAEDPGCINGGVYDPYDDDETNPPSDAATCFGFAADMKGSVTGTQVNFTAGWATKTNANEFPDSATLTNASLESGFDDEPPFLTAAVGEVENSYDDDGGCNTRATLGNTDGDLDNLAPLPDVPPPLNPIDFSAQVLEARANASCDSAASGSVTILNGELNVDGQSIPVSSNPGPNTEVLEVGPILGTYLQVVLNEQNPTSNGIEVNAVHIIGTVAVAGVAHDVDVIIGHAEAGVEDCP